jgi:hypothetical protein
MEADPSGQTEFCIGNNDIHYVDTCPAYYDGSLEILERDENLTCYNIIGSKITDKGIKVFICPLSL